MRGQRIAMWTVMMIILASIAYASGLTTGALVPPTRLMCGNSLPTTGTIEAQNVTNTEGSTLYNVTATLNVAPNIGGISVSSANPQTISSITSGSTVSSIGWNISCNANYPGNYTLYVSYTASGGVTSSSAGSAQSIINVSPNIDSTAPIISNAAPNGNVASSTINITANTNEPAMCRYDPSDTTTFGGNTFDSYYTAGYTTSHIAVLTGLGEGTYNYYVKCQDSALNYQRSGTRVTFSVDLTAPTVVDAVPNRLLLSYGTFNVTTNEDASCKYSLNSSATYDNMSGIFAGMQRNHTTTLSRLTKGVNNIYIRCKDTAGNAASSDYIAQVSYEAGPSAEIALSKTSPLKPGVIELTLSTSEELQSAPKLSYTLDGADETAIILSGEKKTWKGYLMLAETLTAEKVGSFTYSGTDIYGNLGSVVTKGAVFLVDPVKPIAPSGLTLTAANRSLTLSWDAVTDSVDYYAIYRSEKANVTESDYLNMATKTSYEDRSIMPGKTYYYRVAAIDTAGNTGTLSDTISISANGQAKIEAATPSVNADAMRKELDNALSNMLTEIDKTDEQIKTIRTELKEKQPEESESLQVVQLTREAETSLRELKKTIEGASLTADNNAYRSQIETTRRNLNEIRSKVPSAIETIEKQSMQMTPDEDTIAAAYKIRRQALKQNTTDKESIAYATKAISTIELAKSMATLKVIKVSYLDGHTTTLSMITKQLMLDGVKGSYVIEMIPKSVIDTYDKIKFLTKNYEIIQKDIIRWKTTNDETQTLTYIIPTTLSSDDLRKMQTVPLIELAKGNQISGMAIIDAVETYTGMQWWIAGILLASVLGLAGYYVTLDDDNIDRLINKVGGPSTRIRKANKAIDEMRYPEAYDEYVILTQMRVGARYEQQVYDVYNKLMLYNHVTQMQHYASMGNMRAMNDHMRLATEILYQIKDRSGHLCQMAAYYLTYYNSQIHQNKQDNLSKLREIGRGR